MRITWLEALCVLTIAIATLQLKGKEGGTSFLTLPMLTGSKATVIATSAPVLRLTKSTRSDTP